MNILIAAFIIAGCGISGKPNSPAVSDTLPASGMHAYGRTAYSETEGLELISSAAHLGFSFTGSSFTIDAAIHDPSGHNYLQYEMDGIYRKRIKVEGKNQEPITIQATGDGRHTVWLYKATEAQTGPVFIRKITAAGIKYLEKPPAPLIEFIGNSITCGAAADPSEVPCGTGQYHDQHNAYMAYGPRVARALGAEFLMSSVSGYGIYRNWNSDGPALPMVYEKTRLTADDNELWKFEKYRPAVVSIALGTNDYSRGDGKKARLPFDSAAFSSTYIRFVQLVKSKYPEAIILLLGSPMVGGSGGATLNTCITSVKTAIDKLYPAAKPVQLYFFNPMTARGCSGHPSVEDHAILANELIPVFSKLLK